MQKNSAGRFRCQQYYKSWDVSTLWETKATIFALEEIVSAVVATALGATVTLKLSLVYVITHIFFTSLYLYIVPRVT